MLALLQFDSPALPRIEQMLSEGRLPTLAELRKRGRWEAVDANQTVLQSSTYPTLYTGIDVRSHGLYSTFPWSAADQRVRFMHSFPKPPTIWERLTARGRRSLVVDPYLAWAPREMAGVYLNGWQFEDRMATRGKSVPRRERRALSRRYGHPPRLDDVYGTHRAKSLLAWRDHLVSAPRRTADAVRELLGQDLFDLVWINFSAAHKAGHHLWDAAAVTDEPLDDETEQTLGTGLEEVYAAVDAAIGRTLEALPDDADVIVFSPTGMGPNTSLADMLPAMLNAVLTGKAEAGNGRDRFRTPIWSLRSRVPVGWRSSIARALPDRMVADLTTRLYTRADWERTRAITLPGEHTGYIRLNLRGREREGIVKPAEADELLASIAEGLLTFHNPDGNRSIERVARRSELMGKGPRIDRMPDLVVFWGEHPAADVPRVSSARYGDVVRRGVGSGRSGNHTDDAWVIVAPGASRACELGRPVRITDFGATACSLLGADLTGLSGEPLLAGAP